MRCGFSSKSPSLLPIINSPAGTYTNVMPSIGDTELTGVLVGGSAIMVAVTVGEGTIIVGGSAVAVGNFAGTGVTVDPTN